MIAPNNPDDRVTDQPATGPWSGALGEFGPEPAVQTAFGTAVSTLGMVADDE